MKIVTQLKMLATAALKKKVEDELKEEGDKTIESLRDAARCVRPNLQNSTDSKE